MPAIRHKVWTQAVSGFSRSFVSKTNRPFGDRDIGPTSLCSQIKLRALGILHERSPRCLAKERKGNNDDVKYSFAGLLVLYPGQTISKLMCGFHKNKLTSDLGF